MALLPGALQAYQEEGPMYIADCELPEGQRPAAFFCPGFRAMPWWPADSLNQLENHCEQIRDEFQQLRASGVALQPIRGKSITGTWEMYSLMHEGVWNSTNCSLCPVTAAVLTRLPVCESALGHVYFSMLGPKTRVAPHHGVSNVKLRAHLCLDAAPGSAIRVDQTSRELCNGTAMLFDDSYLHTAWNSSDTERVALLVDLWHPDLSLVEQEEIKRVFAADRERAEQAEQQVVRDENRLQVLNHTSLMLLIAQWLPDRDLYHAAISSRCWHQVWVDEDLWQSRTKSTYSITDLSMHNATSWAAVYKYEAMSRFGDIADIRGQARNKLPVCKMLMIGEAQSGKTCYMYRLMEDTFLDHFISTIGIDFRVRGVSCGGVDLRLQLWDISGSERRAGMTHMRHYFRGTHLFFLCYNITDSRSFEGCKNWLDRIIQVAEPGATVFVLGCKKDLKDNRASGCQVSTEQVMAWLNSSEMRTKLAASQLSGVHFADEVSSKTGEGVERTAVLAVRSWLKSTAETAALSEAAEAEAEAAEAESARRSCVVC